MLSEEEALKGLGPIRVVVETVHPDAERDGLKQIQLKTDVELRLRREGVPVISESDPRPGLPYLYVRVSTIKSDNGLYAYSIDVSLRRIVVLNCVTRKIMIAQTWEEGNIGLIGALNLKNVRQTVGDYVDRFINAYLAANPPQRKE